MWKKEDSKPEGVSGSPAAPAISATSSSPTTSSMPSVSGAVPTSSRAAACISQGIRIKGEVTGSEDLFVDGMVEGKLKERSRGGTRYNSGAPAKSPEKCKRTDWPLRTARCCAEKLKRAGSRTNL